MKPKSWTWIGRIADLVELATVAMALVLAIAAWSPLGLTAVVSVALLLVAHRQRVRRGFAHDAVQRAETSREFSRSARAELVLIGRALSWWKTQRRLLRGLVDDGLRIRLLCARDTDPRILAEAAEFGLEVKVCDAARLRVVGAIADPGEPYGRALTVEKKDAPMGDDTSPDVAYRVREHAMPRDAPAINATLAFFEALWSDAEHPARAHEPVIATNAAPSVA